MDTSITGMTESEKQLLNNLLKKYGAENVIECSKKVLAMENAERTFQFSYTFPKVKFADTNSAIEQITHVLTESIEVTEEYTKDQLETNWDRLDEEMADLQHSCETYFRIREKEGSDVRMIYMKVIKKNIVRGYYERE